MSIKQAFEAQLRQWKDVAAAVRDRILAGQQPFANGHPAITYHVADDQPAARTLTGSVGLRKAEIEVRVWAQTSAEAETTAALLLVDAADDSPRLEGMNHVWMGDSDNRKWVQHVKVEQEQEENTAPPEGQKRGPHHVFLRVTIFYDN
jgi:hypothetical protein